MWIKECEEVSVGSRSVSRLRELVSEEALGLQYESSLQIHDAGIQCAPVLHKGGQRCKAF